MILTTIMYIPLSLLVGHCQPTDDVIPSATTPSSLPLSLSLSLFSSVFHFLSSPIPSSLSLSFISLLFHTYFHFFPFFPHSLLAPCATKHNISTMATTPSSFHSPRKWVNPLLYVCFEHLDFVCGIWAYVLFI